MERGPYRASIRCPFAFRNSRGTLEFVLEHDSPILRIRLELHWLEHGDPATGAGIGMYNVSYPTIEGNGYERYDPVRVAYNLVKYPYKSLKDYH